MLWETGCSTPSWRSGVWKSQFKRQVRPLSRKELNAERWKKGKALISVDLIMLQQLKDERTLPFVLFCVLSFWAEAWQTEFKLKTEGAPWWLRGLGIRHCHCCSCWPTPPQQRGIPATTVTYTTAHSSAGYTEWDQGSNPHPCAY